MKKVKLVVFGAALFIIGAIGGILSANFFKTDEAAGVECRHSAPEKESGETKTKETAAAECGHTLEEKMMYWMVNDLWPDHQVKQTVMEIPVSLFPEDYENYSVDRSKKTVVVTAVDLDDDDQSEYIVYSCSGNRNSVYDIFKMYNGKLKHCGETGGVSYVVIKHNGRTGIFSKWGSGYACASYSFHRLVNGKMEQVISFFVDGSGKSIPGKNDKITIELETSNNFMKKQYR